MSPLHPDYSPDLVTREKRVTKPRYEATHDFWVNPIMKEGIRLQSDGFTTVKRVKDADGSYSNYTCTLTYAEYQERLVARLAKGKKRAG